MPKTKSPQERLERAERLASEKRAKAEAAEARLKRTRAVIKHQEISSSGRFARDTGLLVLARLDADAFEGVMLAAKDPKEVERWRRFARESRMPITMPGRAQEAAE